MMYGVIDDVWFWEKRWVITVIFLVCKYFLFLMKKRQKGCGRSCFRCQLVCTRPRNELVSASVMCTSINCPMRRGWPGS